jgi:NAD(P)-dependent dehydrogenase (short-subunit alcohol dehydrogenase family)
MRRTALVTGAGRGIGRAIADALAADAWVAGLDVAFPDGPGALGSALEVDVADPAAVDRAVGTVVDERGGLDTVVCAAGILRDGVSWKLDTARWQTVLDVNLSGAFYVVRAAAPALRRSTAGRVVLISSINGLRGRFGQANYAAAKAGIVGLGKTLAAEFARDGATVNVIAPGYIDTDMTRGLSAELQAQAVARTPMGRMGQPDDIAHLAAFLASDRASFITGTVIPVDGGQLLGASA